MTYPAKYNSPGWLFYPEESVQDQTSFVVYESGETASAVESKTASRGACIKLNTVKSDHVTPTDWYREVVEVLEDKPWSYEETYKTLEGKPKSTNYGSHHLGPTLQNVAFWDYPTGFRAQMDNRIAKLSTKMRNKLHQGKEFALGNALGEAKQTVDLLSGTASTMWQTILALKRRDPRQFQKALGMNAHQMASEFGKDGAGKYLQVQYGFIPLASDCYDLYQKLSKDTAQDLTFTVNGRESVSFDEQTTPFLRHTWQGELQAKLKVRLAEAISHKMDEWGLLNPLSIAWELTPFSFMIDWGIPIGNVLESISATAGLEFVSGYMSDSRDGQRTINVDMSDLDEVEHVRRVVNRGSHVTRYYTFRRTRWDSFPPPMLYGKDNPFSTQHVANALAVFRQLI